MEGSDGSPPQSLCMIRAAELFPKPSMEKEDTQLTVPFQELAGESVKYLGRTDDGVLALSNYRIFLLKNSMNSEQSVPLGLIESAQTRDLFHLIVNCKDASTVKCSFETAEQCSEWQRRIQMSVGVPETWESLFAFPFCSWTCDNAAAAAASTSSTSAQNGTAADNCSPPSPSDYSERLQRASRYENDFLHEIERLGFDLNGSWRISNANDEFKLCPSYPQKILVPCCISDETLNTVANFRGSRRLPSVVWRHRKSGAVIARCSQPEVGWLGWRNAKDEQLLKALADACAFDRGEQQRRLVQAISGAVVGVGGGQSSSAAAVISGDSSPSSPDCSHEEVALDDVRKVLIVDARSYTSAVTNRARGGGCECIEYYPCAEIEFMNLGNIHVIRKSFHALRQLCASPSDVPNWLGLLEKTMWLQHLSGLLAASMTVCHAIEKKGRPVLVHCSDGWDRTPQIVATAQLCLDPYYRTVEGFRILVEREWLSYGHKFSDRCGHGPGSDELNERCPVFLQWLDLIHQIHKQFPCSFEFSMGYLIKLAQHSLSCLFGTFLGNTLKERIENSVFERTFSVWPFLSGPMYRNPLYIPNREKVIWPAYNVRDLSVWTEVYLGSLGNQNSIDFPACNVDGLHGSMSPMAKTRSYGDLITAGIMQNGISRRSSDPNMIVDPNLTISSNSENNSIADIQSEREDSPDIIANIIHDTTRKLQNLTIELNNHDDEIFGNLQQKDAVARFIETERRSGEGENSDVETNNYDGDSPSFSSPLLNNLNQIVGRELNARACPAPLTFIPCTAGDVGASFAPATDIMPEQNEIVAAASMTELQNGFNGLLKNLSDDCKEATNGGVDNFSGLGRNSSRRSSDGNGGCIEEHPNGITIHKMGAMHLNLLESVDLGSADNPCTFNNGLTTNSSNGGQQQNMWYGSVNTSTDTLVPIESRQQNLPTNGDACHTLNELLFDSTDGGAGTTSSSKMDKDADESLLSLELLKENRKSNITNINSVHSSTTNSSSNSTNCSILPKVHSSNSNNSSNNSNSVRPNVLSTSSSNASNSSTSSSLNNLNKIGNTANSSSSISITNNNSNSITNHNLLHTRPAPPPPTATANAPVLSSTPSDTAENLMEESILILPEHQKLEISFSGKCETILNNVAIATNATLTNSYSYAPFATATAQRRRRTSSSNSRRDCPTTKPVNGSTSRFSLSGVRSLPMTPPGLPERPQIAISCPDGLAHALSEQNIRLQQIVHEHKLREDVLLREIHDMRMALLKKICPNCNNAPATNDEQVDEFLYENRNRRLLDLCKCCTARTSWCATCSKSKQVQQQQQQRQQRRRHHARRLHHRNQYQFAYATECSNDDDENCACDCDCECGCDCEFNDDEDNGSSSLSACSALDNVENASICSWEAVEDRSGPSSCNSSSIQPNTATSVLWVPDHAVSRCTSCQTEFWLGRRKHHCRSCGQIFCADCSEFWAPLPDEKLFNPVRLCGPCYHAVTTRMQQQNRSFIAGSSATNNSSGSVCGSKGNGNSMAAAKHNPLLTTSAPALTQRQMQQAAVAVAVAATASNSQAENAAIGNISAIAAASVGSARNNSNSSSNINSNHVSATLVEACCNQAAAAAATQHHHQTQPQRATTAAATN